MGKRWKSDEMQALRVEALPRYETYVRDVLRPALGLREPIRLEVPRGGRGSFLYFLIADGLQPAVLRAVKSRRALLKRSAAHRFLREQGLSVSRVLHVDKSWRTRRRWGSCFLLEQRMAGGPLGQEARTRKLAAELGLLFARIHSVRSRYAGDLGRIRGPWFSLGHQLRRRAWRHLRRFAKRESQGHGWLHAWLKRMPRRAFGHSPRLVMGDAAANNFLVDGKAISLIDLSIVRFHSAPWELTRIWQWTLERDLEAWRIWLAAYLGACDSALREDHARLMPLCFAVHHLRCSLDAEKDERERHLDELDRLVRGEPGSWPCLEP